MSDNEAALVDAFTFTIFSPTGCFKNSSYQTDFHHLATKPWKKIIGSCKDDDSHSHFSSYSNIVYFWIRSWFVYIETEDQYKKSYKNFDLFFIKFRNVFGSMLIGHIKKSRATYLAKLNMLDIITLSIRQHLILLKAQW